MLRKLLAAACFALCMANSPSYAQSSNANVVSSCGSVTYDTLRSFPLTQDSTGKLCTAASVAVSGFAPGLTYANLTATASSASVALPAGAVVGFQNSGTTTVSCTLGVGSATATANEIQVPPSSTVFVTVGSNTFGACIDQTGSASNAVVLMGGTGLGTGFGGGGGSGGGGAITAAASSYSAGAFVAGTGVDGWDVTQGLKTDAACAGDNTSGCTVEARLQRIAQNLTTLNTTAGAAVAAGTNVIGKVGIDQTTPGTTNLVALANNQSVNVAQFGGVSTSTGQVAVSVAPVTATNTALVTALRPDSPGIITLGANTVANSVPITGNTTPTIANGNGVVNAPSAESLAAITPVVSSALESNHVIKASAGNFYSGYVTTGAVAGWLLLANSTTAPTAGGAAIAPIACVVAPANATTAIGGQIPIRASTGITLVFSSSGCLTNTASTTAYFSGLAN